MLAWQHQALVESARLLTHQHYTLSCNAMVTKQRQQKDRFSSQPGVQSRALMDESEAAAITRLFKAFANETRLRLLHALVRAEEMCVTDLAEAVEMKPQAVSNQLQRLVDRGMLAARREGINIYYRVVDPCVAVLLERGFCLITCCPDDES